MVNSITCIFSLDFSDPIPNRFNRCLRIHLGDIISPRCFLTVSDISASLSPSNAIIIQVTLCWFTFEPLKALLRSLIACLQMSENYGLLKRCWNCRSLRNSFFCSVLQDGSKQRHGIISIRNDRLVQTSAAWMLELIPVCPCQLPSLNPFKTRRSIVLKQDGKDICWVPSHTGIKGNEKADSAAKSALDLPRAKVGVPYNDFKHYIDQYIFSTWQDDWNGAVANKLHSDMSSQSWEIGRMKLSCVVPASVIHI